MDSICFIGSFKFGTFKVSCFLFGGIIFWDCLLSKETLPDDNGTYFLLLLVYKIINIYSHVLFFILIIWILIIIILVVLLVENFLYQVFAASNSNAFFSFKIIHLFILDIILLYRVLILVMLFVNILKLIFILIINHEIFFLLVFYLLLIILEIILVQLAIILNNLLHLLFLAAM